MSIYEEVREALIREWRGGATQQEMADRAGVTNPYINNLLSGKRKVESMKLETLFKLFPHAEIRLERPQIAGDAAAVHASGTNGNVVGVNRGAVDGDWVQSAMQKILETEELTDAEKVKFLKVLQS